MSVVVMVKPVSEDTPEQLTHFIVTATWEDQGSDVDIWGKRCNVENTDCGFPCREVSNLRLHGDWTRSTSDMLQTAVFATETMTIDAIIQGEYGFALQGFSLENETTVRISIASVKPFKILMDKEIVVSDGQWASIGRVTIDEDGRVLSIDESLEVTFD